MTKFSKSWNPRKRRIRRKPDFNERKDMAVKVQLIDRRCGYELPLEYYQEIAEGKR